MGKGCSQFQFSRLANTHAKILIFDDVWVNTSLNWLSFKGDPHRTYRMEEGTLVALPEIVDEQYGKYVSMIETQKIDAPPPMVQSGWRRKGNRKPGK